MNFSIPSPRHYITGLAIIAALSILLYFIHSSLSLTQLNPLVIAISGLFIGHLIGTLIREDNTSHQQSISGIPTQKTAASSNERQTLYVGNIAYRANRQELEKLFSRYGTVHSVRIMLDKQTRKSRGYGFIEMDRNGAKQAVSKLNGFEFKGRNLKVNEAEEKE